MNIALFAISTFIVIICIGIPVAKHPHWFNTYEEQVQAAKDKGYCAMATPVKIRNLPYDSSEPTYKNYNYSVVYQCEFEGRIYTKRRQQNDYPEPRMFYFPSGNPKRAFCCREDQPMTIGSWIPVLMLVAVGIVYRILSIFA
jgi:hypothetical protein